MTLISGIRDFITRKKTPLATDIAEPQADGAVEEVNVTGPTEVIDDEEAMAAVALDVEPEPLPQAGIASGALGIDVAAAVESLGDRLDTQGDRLEAQTAEVRRLIQHLEQLPLVLKEAAEIKGHCAQVVELVSGQVSEARTRADAVVEAVNETRRHEDAVMEAINATKGREDAVMEAINVAKGREDAVMEAVNEAVRRAVSAAVRPLGEASSRDAEALDRIQQQLESNGKVLRAAGENEEGLSQNLREALESSIGVQRALANLEQSQAGREAQIAMQFAASKRTMMLLAFACTLASLVALIVAVIALVM